ncbi:MAG: cytochrome c1 [Alphaproteobacteria bacterium]|nr:cytochrome c1 [Alphaproteobacteria bacterium]
MFRAGLVALLLALPFAATAAEAPKPPPQPWSYQGVFGVFDRPALQRGFLVYKQVCSACHSMSRLSYRNLLQLGFDEAAAAGFAAEVQIADGPNDEGEMYDRPGRLSDRFKKPFANEKAARASNNGAYPPDLSLMAKARPVGADYSFALLTGYINAPSNVQLMEGMHYNKYFPGFQIAMAPPLAENAVEFPDGTPASIENMARDVVQFLAWAAEPKMEERKRIGVKAMLFVLVLTALLYAVKRKVWAAVH